MEKVKSCLKLRNKMQNMQKLNKSVKLCSRMFSSATSIQTSQTWITGALIHPSEDYKK